MLCYFILCAINKEIQTEKPRPIISFLELNSNKIKIEEK